MSRSRRRGRMIFAAAVRRRRTCDAAVDMILAAERPVIFIGHGVTLSEAGAELTALAAALRIPVISSPNGMGCIDMARRPVAGLHRPQRRLPGESGRAHADLVMAVGARFDDRSASPGCQAIRGTFRPRS